MATNIHPFTPEQQEILRANIYTRKVTENSISFTLAFKQRVIEEIDRPGVTFPKILQDAGYDLDMLGRARIRNILQRIRHEATSERGLHETGPSRESIAASDLEKKKTSAAIHELQDHVEYLEQQVAFLKKISLLRNRS